MRYSLLFLYVCIIFIVKGEKYIIDEIYDNFDNIDNMKHIVAVTIK